MSDFTASNGITIKTDEYGDMRLHLGGGFNSLDGYDYLGHADIRALREFFQAEADERLGRWRWPENPDYVVYRTETEDCIEVVRESDRLSLLSTREHVGDFSDSHAAAARAYFDAHPEPKPWHDAAEGEVWALTIGDDEEPRAWMAEGDGPRFWRGGHSIDRLSGSIAAGRRIWPEVAA